MRLEAAFDTGNLRGDNFGALIEYRIQELSKQANDEDNKHHTPLGCAACSSTALLVHSEQRAHRQSSSAHGFSPSASPTAPP